MSTNTPRTHCTALARTVARASKALYQRVLSLVITAAEMGQLPALSTPDGLTAARDLIAAMLAEPAETANIAFGDSRPFRRASDISPLSCWIRRTRCR